MPEQSQTPFDELGEATIRRLAQRFYERMDAEEPALAKLHRLDEQGRVHPEMRERFGLFLVFWLGGHQEYIAQRGHPRLRMRHAHFPVDVAMRDAWLRCMRGAMNDLGIEGRVREFLDQRFTQVADFLRNVVAD